MSGSEVNFNVTANTSEFDAALEAASATAKTAFASMKDSAGGSVAAMSLSLRQLQQQLGAARLQLASYGDSMGGVKAAIQQYISDTEAQIAAMQASSSAAKEASAATAATVEANEAAAGSLVQLSEGFAVINLTVQQAIDAQMNWERGVLSASESAKVFTSTLETMGLSMAEVTAEAEAQAEAMARLGSGITMLESKSLQELINTNLGVTKSFSDARQSASTFTSEFANVEQALSEYTQGQNVANAGLNDAQTAFARANGMIGEYEGNLVRLGPAEEAAAAAMGTFNTAGHMNAGVMREIIVEGRELITGNLNRMPGSLMVLAERFGNVTTAMMGWVAGAAVAGFAIVELIEHFEKLTQAVDQAQAAMAVFDPSITKAGIQSLDEELERVPGVTAIIANQSVADMGRMQDVTQSAMQVMIASVGQFTQAVGGTVPENLSKMAAAYADPINKGEEFKKDLGLTGQQLAEFDKAMASGDATQIRVQLLQDIVSEAEKVTAANDEATISTLRLNQANSMGGKFAMGREGAYAGSANAELQEQIQLQKDLKKAEDDAASNTATTGGAAGGGASWIDQQTTALDALKSKVLDSATNWKTAQEQETQTDVTFWQGVIQRGNLSSSQLAQAKENLFNAQQSLDQQTLTAGTASANSGTQAQIAALNAQQAAAYGNASQIEDIEQQKLQVLAQAYGQNSRQYQDELAKQVEMTRQAANDETSSMKTTLAAQSELDKQAASEYLAGLKSQVDVGTITHEEMLSEYKNFIEQQNQAQLSSLDTLISTLQVGTAQYAAALKERAALYAQFQQESDSIDQQIASAATKSAQQQGAVYTQMFNSIGSTAKSQIDQIVLLQQTWAGAAEKVYGSILTSFVNMATQMLARWTATLIAQTVMNNTQLAAQVAAQQAAGNSGWGAMIMALLRYAGLITTTTSAATVQQGVAAVAQVHSAAAVAAANSFASTAAIPYVGPELAPAAAASAMAEVDAFAGAASLAVGAWNVPQNMPANLHAGEMVVPANFASGLRSNMALGGTPSSTAISYNPTVNASGGLQASDVQSMLNTQFSEMVMYFSNMMRNGNLQLPGRI